MNAGGSTFKSSPYYLSQVNGSKIPNPIWKDFDKEHPVDKYNIITKNCSDPWDSQQVAEIRRHYYAMLAEVDQLVGQVVKAIPKSKRASTVIMFSSDHGDLAMEHRQYYKMSLYEGSARVPLIFSGEPFRQNVMDSAPASLIDIYPTLLELANLHPNMILDGISLISSTPPPPNRPIISQYHAEHMNSSAFMIYELVL